MIPRLIELTKEYNLILFGPRGVGKSTLVRNLFDESYSVLFNLLKVSIRERFKKRPEELAEIVRGLPESTTHVIIDEIQKVPDLLDVIHDLIETTNKKFIMTGSSARKLKYNGANLLAGRAFIYHLHPFSVFEIPQQFDLIKALQWGMLPKVFEFADDKMKQHYLEAYSHTHLKEEIWEEHIIKNLDPFRRFLEVAAQMNGKIIDYSKIAKVVGTDDKTVKNYYIILEDTLLGFFLEGFEHSFRKRLATKPKFYFFDTGIVRSLSRMLTLPLQQSTAAYGEVFEHFVMLEIFKLCSYFHTEYKLSYLKTKDDVEIDLVVDRPGLPVLFIEIKSATQVTREILSSFIKITKDFGECEAVCFSDDPLEKKIEHVRVLPWKTGLKRYFLNQKSTNLTL